MLNEVTIDKQYKSNQNVESSTEYGVLNSAGSIRFQFRKGEEEGVVIADAFRIHSTRESWIVLIPKILSTYLCLKN